MNNTTRLLILLILHVSTCLTGWCDDKDARRQTFIKDFVQYYQEAYQKGKIGFIEQIFGNDALIITETKTLIPIGSELVPNTSKNRPYHTLVADKKTYLKKLNEYFSNHKKINIGISSLLIQRHPKYPEIYGVYFFQTWEDVGNGDILENKMPGYIFLMIDFRDNELQPIIHVRTWQPKSNISKPADKYQLTDFRIISTR